MPVTPNSSAARAMHGAMDLIAKSAVFTAHSATHHPDDEPIDSIYLNDVWKANIPLPDLRPFVVISLAEHSYETLAQCSAPSLVVNGGIVVAFFDDSRHADDKDSATEFFNWMYGTLDDQNGEFGRDTNYPFTSIETLVPPDRPDINQRKSPGGDYWFGAVRFGHERK